MDKQDLKTIFFRRFLWIVPGAIGGICSAMIWFLMPHKSEIDSIWQVVFKIASFIFLILSISFFPNNLKKGFLLLLIPLFAYTAYLGPKVSYYGFIEIPRVLDKAFSEYYTLLYLLVYPTLIMSVCFSYRIGGGTSGNCFKIGVSGIIILFSGFLDLMWYMVNPVSIPETIHHAHHIKVILGHYPTFFESIIFCLGHLPFMLLILSLPLDVWINKIFKTKEDDFSQNGMGKLVC